MRIVPITTNLATRNFATQNYNIEFIGNKDYKDIKEVVAHARKENLCIGAAFVLFIGAMLGMGITSDSNNKAAKKFSEDVQNIYNSDDIQKDTFSVKDITGDENPDLILYKKDGSKVVIDIANQKVLEETTTLNPIE